MFDDIRPYNDSEIPAAMQRIVSDKYFPLVCDFLFPEKPVHEIAGIIGSCRTTEEFQRRFMYKAIYSVVDKTTDGLSVEGMERLDPGTDYLFVSNHRDIMLDAAFLQVLLLDAGRRTSEITFGANLMQGQLVIDTGKEVITEKVGFRKVEVRDLVLTLNGAPIKFRGVNRHESDPVTGAVISLDQALKDLRMIKANNFNAVRASHYPNSP